MKKMITAYENGGEICEITEAFNSLSIETICCDTDEVENIASEYESGAVFSVGFKKRLSDLCKKKGIPYISWVLTSPGPELFVPQLLNPVNRVFVADSGLYRIMAGSGIRNVFYAAAGFKEAKDRIRIVKNARKIIRPEDIRERIMFALCEDEKKYLLGIERAQELVHTEDMFFRGLPGELVDKIYDALKLSGHEDPVSKRYYIAHCLLREGVKHREKSRMKMYRGKKGIKISCFDDTGVESLSAVLCGCRLYTDGCGVLDLALERNEDYIIYDDMADLAYKLKDGTGKQSPGKKISEYSVKNVVRKMIF